MTLKTDIEIICLPFPENFFMLFYLFTGSGTVAVSSFFQPTSSTSGATSALVLLRFKHLAAKMGSAPTPLTGSDLPQSQLNNTLAKYRSSRFSMLMLCPTGRHVVHHASRLRTLCWTCWLHLHHKHILSVFFSACGMLSHGGRNRMSTLLEMCVHLKLT